MATQASAAGTPDPGRRALGGRARDRRSGDRATGLLRALVLVVIFYATIMNLIVLIGGYASARRRAAGTIGRGSR